MSEKPHVFRQKLFNGAWVWCCSALVEGTAVSGWGQTVRDAYKYFHIEVNRINLVYRKPEIALL